MLFPGTTITAPLEFEWATYQSVIAFSTARDLSEIANWYKGEIGIKTKIREPGKLEFYFPDSIDPEFSLLAADFTCQDAVDDLHAYIGSSVLQSISKPSDRVIGVYFTNEKEGRTSSSSQRRKRRG